MGRIQSSIGLITGVPIGQTVDALMALAARPRDLLVARTNKLQEEQMALNSLSALLLSVKYVTDKLGEEDLYEKRKATSSHPDVLSASVTGSPPKGSFQFIPIRVAHSQQWLSSGFRTDTDSVGGGRLTFRFGDHVQRAAQLEMFGGGEGVLRGWIRITDRSGAVADVDLSTVQTVDDVLEAINRNPTIDVTAVARGGGIRLIDNTGQSASNLKVEQLGGGGTAESLGLAGIDVAADVADGQDMLRLYHDLQLDALNDGSGVRRNRVLDDVEYELRDGTSGTIDFSPIEPNSSEVDEEITLGEILEVINAAEPGNLLAEIAPDGKRLVITDLTEGDGTFQLSPLNESEVLSDLGLDGEAADGVIVGQRIMAGGRTVLLSSLGGGNGLGQLGMLGLTDRSGATGTVDLSAAETLEQVIETINAAEVGIRAQVNHARNGIELVDTTGSDQGHLIVSNADETETADKLGIAVDDDVLAVNSGDLHLQVVAENTKLSDLNGGAGVARAKFTIIDTDGQGATVNLAGSHVQTVGDVIREINRADVKVHAELNGTGDGILIRDTAHGPGTLRVEEGGSTAAADLHLLGSAVEVDIGGEATQVIDGSTTYTIELDEDDSLIELRTKINDLGAPVTAAVLVAGSSKPYRLSLVSDEAGNAGQLVLDTSEVSFSVEETVRGQDALLVFGDAQLPASNVLISSTSNTFDGVLPGLNLTIEQASDKPVTVTVSTSDADLVAAVESMVENYNRFRERLAQLTTYDTATEKRSVLTGDGTALRLDIDLSYVLSGRFAGAGPIRSLAEVGIGLKDDGTLSLDKFKLKAKYAADPETVKEFFSADTSGLSGKLANLIDSLSDEDTSLLANRLDALDRKIAQNEQRIALMNDRLDAERERLLLQFYRMETAVAKLRSNLAALESFQALPPLITLR